MEDDEKVWSIVRDEWDDAVLTKRFRTDRKAKYRAEFLRRQERFLHRQNEGLWGTPLFRALFTEGLSPTNPTEDCTDRYPIRSAPAFYPTGIRTSSGASSARHPHENRPLQPPPPPVPPLTDSY